MAHRNGHRILSLETCAAADIVYILNEHLHTFLDDANVQLHKDKILECIATNDLNGEKLKDTKVSKFAQMIIKYCGDKKLNAQLRKIHKELIKFDFTHIAIFRVSNATANVDAADDEKKDDEPMTTERLQEVFASERAAAASSKSTLTQSTTAMTTEMGCSPQGCDRLQRLIKLLHFHQQLLDLNNYDLMLAYALDDEDGGVQLLNDWHHVLFDHVGSAKQSQLLYDRLMLLASFKKCELETCAAFKRNSREREHDDKAYGLPKDEKHAFFVDLLDTIHCHLLHSFDCGYRQRTSDIEPNDQKNNDDEEEDSADILTWKQNPAFQRMVSTTRAARQRIGNVPDKPTVSLKVSDDGDGDGHDEDDDADSKLPELPKPYSFGCLERFEDIKPIYQDLKDEVLNSKKHAISRTLFDQLLESAKQHAKTDHAKQIRHKYYTDPQSAPKDEEKEKKIRVRQRIRTRPMAFEQFAKESGKNGKRVSAFITIDHLLAVTLYCALTELQSEFSRTFRMIAGDKDEEDVKKRNREYGHWRRLLSEAVNDYGDAIGDTATSSLYTGINAELVFPSLTARFNCPTSLTATRDVAVRFAENGIIVELKKDTADFRFFNCTWLSRYASEDERLVLFTPSIRLHNIYVMRTGMRCKPFLHALNWFNHCIVACKPPGHGDGKSATKKDGRLMALMLNQSRDQMAGQKYEYVWKLFDYLDIVHNVDRISIEMDYMDQFYGVFSPLLFAENGVFRFANICKVFPNCKKIWIHYRKNNELDFVAKRDEFLKEFEETVKHVERLVITFNAKPAAYEVKQLGNHQHVQIAGARQDGQGNITLIVAFGEPLSQLPFLFVFVGDDNELDDNDGDEDEKEEEGLQLRRRFSDLDVSTLLPAPAPTPSSTTYIGVEYRNDEPMILDYNHKNCVLSQDILDKCPYKAELIEMLFWRLDHHGIKNPSNRKQTRFIAFAHGVEVLVIDPMAPELESLFNVAPGQRPTLCLENMYKLFPNLTDIFLRETTLSPRIGGIVSAFVTKYPLTPLQRMFFCKLDRKRLKKWDIERVQKTLNGWGGFQESEQMIVKDSKTK